MGGVAAIAILGLGAWFLLRRKRQSQYQNQNPYEGQETPLKYQHQLDGNQIVHEADGQATKYTHHGELPAEEAPVELAGSRP